MAEQITNGGPAFPPVHDPEKHPSGMTLLDHFAGLALQALIVKFPLFDREGEHGEPTTQEVIDQVRADIAESAYWYAAAMLIEKEKRA